MTGAVPRRKVAKPPVPVPTTKAHPAKAAGLDPRTGLSSSRCGHSQRSATMRSLLWLPLTSLLVLGCNDSPGKVTAPAADVPNGGEVNLDKITANAAALGPAARCVIDRVPIRGQRPPHQATRDRLLVLERRAAGLRDGRGLERCRGQQRHREGLLRVDPCGRAGYRTGPGRRLIGRCLCRQLPVRRSAGLPAPMDRLSRAGSLEPIGELRLSLAGVTGPSAPRPCRARGRARSG